MGTPNSIRILYNTIILPIIVIKEEPG
jgi:hypothetical protein